MVLTSLLWSRGGVGPLLGGSLQGACAGALGDAGGQQRWPRALSQVLQNLGFGDLVPTCPLTGRPAHAPPFCDGNGGARSHLGGSGLKCSLKSAAMQARTRPTLVHAVLTCTLTGLGARAPTL